MSNSEQSALLKRDTRAWNAWRKSSRSDTPIDLRGVSLSGGNLESADLHEASLEGCDLRRANLRGANLRGANLDSADLRGASLEGCDLRQANLIDANLASANLTAANLTAADLRRSNLHGALLRDINLENAVLGGTLFANVDLRSASGLSLCKHEGPSSVDFATLSKSPGIPPPFLLATGLPQTLIEYLHAFIEHPGQFYSCFISYSHKDEGFARKLHTDLQLLGIRTWFAPHDLQPGRIIREDLDSAIRVHDKLVLVLSRESTRSEWVRFEVEKALSVERDTKRTVLFPLTLDQSIFQKAVPWLQSLRERHILNFSDWTNAEPYRLSLSRLAKALTLTAASEMPERR